MRLCSFPRQLGRGSALAAMALGMLTLAGARSAAAYCVAKTSGTVPFASWKTLPVTYRVSDTVTDPKIVAAIDAAFNAWGSVPCSKLKFTKGASFTPCLAEPCAAATVKFKHETPYIFVFWVTTAWSGFDNPTTPKMPFASNSFFWDDHVGGLTGASIAVNAKDYAFSGDLAAGCSGVFDVKNFVMPLVGGAIGLRDSDYKPSVMDGEIKFCSTEKHNLTADDKNGLYFHYSDGTCPAPPQPNASGCAGGPGGQPSGDGQARRDGGVPVTDGPRREGGGPVSESGVPIAREAGAPQCTSSGQCASGELCDVTGHCVPGGDGGGCCRVSHAGARLNGVPTALLVLALLAVGLRRRRGGA